LCLQRWSTGPTSLLSFYVAGIHLTSSIGRTWRIAPNLGDLTEVEAGYETPLGKFTSSVKAGKDGQVVKLKFSTPAGTKGEVGLPGVQGKLVSKSGQSVVLVGGTASGLAGGEWSLEG